MQQTKTIDRSLSILSYLAPPPEESLCEWAERCIVFGARQPTAYPGPLRLDTTPYLRGIFDALDDANTRVVVIEAAAQTGKTTAAYVWLAHAAATDPGPALFVYPSEDLARSVSATRIQPMFEDSPELSELIPNNRKEAWQLLSYSLPGGVINGCGANSPAQISSRPIRYLLLDEIDKYPSEAMRSEADAVSLALQRTKAFYNSQAVMVSTPTVPDGAIHQHFCRGDRREFFIKCPACSHEYNPRFREHVKWTENEPATAAICCPSCGHAMSEAERRSAIRGGRWIAQSANGETGVVSFHLSGLLATWCDLPALVTKFLRVKASPVRLRDFINSDLGEPFIPADARVADNDLSHRVGSYDIGEMPLGSEPVYGGMDVQKGYFVLVLRQFNSATGDSAQVWRGILHAWSEVDAIMAEYSVDAICVDARYRSQEVYDMALNYQGIWPVIGVSGFRVPALYEQRTVDVDEGRHGRGGGRVVSVLSANSNALLDMLSERIKAEDGAPDWQLPRGADADRDYVAQMTAMYRHNGSWINPSRSPEHYMDAEKLAILAAWYAGARPGIDIEEEYDADDVEELKGYS